MQKVKQILIMVVFIGISFMINFFDDKDSYTEMETNIKKIEVLVEGAIEGGDQIFLFDEEISIEDLLLLINLDNDAAIECLNLKKVIKHQERIYIPYRQNIIVSLNSSNLEDFILINGIGEATANKILEYRKNQYFESIESIMEIKGIKEKRYLKYRSQLCL
jgi:DNA uptake protein and related DNA-binding proteins